MANNCEDCGIVWECDSTDPTKCCYLNWTGSSWKRAKKDEWYKQSGCRSCKARTPNASVGNTVVEPATEAKKSAEERARAEAKIAAEAKAAEEAKKAAEDRVRAEAKIAAEAKAAAEAKNAEEIIRADSRAAEEAKGKSSSTATLAVSNFKQIYSGCAVPMDDIVLLSDLKTFLNSFAAMKHLPVGRAETFFGTLRREGLALDQPAMEGPANSKAALRVVDRVTELLEDVPALAQRLWTSVSTMNIGGHDRELCSIINEAIRQDNPDLLQPLMSIIRAINKLCVVRGARLLLPEQWPATGTCFRGASLPAVHNPFFSIGKQYRIPGFLATSLSEDVALDFVQRKFVETEGAIPAVLWIVKVDPKGATNPRFRCQQVNYVAHSNLGEDEQEFLFAPYSAFTVVDLDWSHKPNYVTPHRITLAAAPDNLLEDESLPLAPWY